MAWSAPLPPRALKTTYWRSLTEASANQMVTPPGAKNAIPRAQPLLNNASHNVEHYGKLVNYFRIKGMVPPSTKRESGGN